MSNEKKKLSSGRSLPSRHREDTYPREGPRARNCCVCWWLCVPWGGLWLWHNKTRDIGIWGRVTWRHLDPLTARRPLGPSVRGPGDMVSDAICRRWMPSRQGATAQRGSLVPYTHFSDHLWIMMIFFGIWVITFEDDRSSSNQTASKAKCTRRRCQLWSPRASLCSSATMTTWGLCRFWGCR